MIKLVLFFLRLTKKVLIRYIESIPNHDAYAEVYSVTADSINHIAETIEDLPQALKSAALERKKNPERMDNRAKDWCWYSKD